MDFAQCSESQTSGCSVVGHLEIRPFTSSVFHNTRMLRIWLPPAYTNWKAPKRRYPVLYLNYGQPYMERNSIGKN